MRCFLTTETENKIIVNDNTILNSVINSAVIFLNFRHSVLS